MTLGFPRFSRLASRHVSGPQQDDIRRVASSDLLPAEAQEGILVDIDVSGLVANVAHLGGETAGLVLPLQRSVPLEYQLEKVSPVLARATMRALEDRRPFTAVNLGRGADGGLYLINSRLHVGPRGENSTLVMSIAASASDEALASYASLKEEQAERVTNLIRLLGQATGVADTARQMLPRLLGLTSMEAAGVFLVSSGTHANVIAAYGPTRTRGSAYAPLALEEPVVRALVTRPRVAQFTGKAPLPTAIASLACADHGCLVIAPAVAGGSATALLVLSRRQPGPLALNELETIEAVRHAFGLLVRNRYLDENSQRAEPILQTAYMVSRAVSGSLDLERTFSEITRHAAQTASDSHCVLLEREEASGDFVSVAASDAIAEGLLRLQPQIKLEDAALDALRSSRSVQLQDAEWGRTLEKTVLKRAGVKSAMLVPMSARNDLIGALLLHSQSDRGRYSEAETAHAEAVAEQAAIAIHNARLYRSLTASQTRIQSLLTRLSETREQERKRLAQLVHDDILQAIVAAAYRLDAFRRVVTNEHTEEFDEVVDLLRRTIVDARRVIWEMRPPVLDTLGLAEALRALATQGGVEGEAQIEVDCDALPAISTAVGTAIYRMAREALLNARRHARAHRIRLSLKADSASGTPAVRLRVEDDGIGFDTGAETSPEHYGHAMIEEQATVLSGFVLIESEPGQGTRVDILVPTHE